MRRAIPRAPSSPEYGFSLAELLVVTAIVVALAAVAVPLFATAQKAADLRTCFMDAAVAAKDSSRGRP